MIGCDWTVGYREIHSKSTYGVEVVGISCASDISAPWNGPAMRKPEISLATLTILLAPMLALLAHSLRKVSGICNGVGGKKILLVFSKES